MITRLFATLMEKEPGYHKFMAQGGDGATGSFGRRYQGVWKILSHPHPQIVLPAPFKNVR